MADSVNKVMLIGYAGKEPDVRFSQNGTATAKFSLATSARWTTEKGEPKEETTWHRITIFGKRAESVSKYIFKGTYLRIEGSIKNGKYTNDKGVDIYTSEIICKEIGFLSTKEDNQKLAQQLKDPPMDPPQQVQQRTQSAPKQKPQSKPPVNSENPDDFESPPEEFNDLPPNDDIPF